VDRTTRDEPSLNLPGGVELPTAERPRTLDAVSRAIIVRRLGLEQRQNPFRAVGRPQRDTTPIGFAEGL